MLDKITTFLKYKANVWKIKSTLIRDQWIKAKGIYPSYYDEKKLIFIHIPKAAGRSVSTSIFGDDKPGHYYSSDYKSVSKEKFDEYFKFTFVREPLDRLHSSYNYLTSGGGNEVDRLFGQILKESTKSFEDFVLNWLTTERLNSWVHFVPQHQYIYLKDGECGVDFIGKFENIDSDFNKLKEQINIEVNLPHNNKNHLSKDKKYKKEVIDKVRSLYSDDYRLFDYL